MRISDWSSDVCSSDLLALLAFLPLVACGPQGDQSSGDEAPLAGAKIGGNFTLVDQDGRKVSYSDFDGKYRMLYFGYSYCPDVCPLDLQKLMQGYRLFEKQDPARAAKEIGRESRLNSSH